MEHNHRIVQNLGSAESPDIDERLADQLIIEFGIGLNVLYATLYRQVDRTKTMSLLIAMVASISGQC